MSFTWFGYQYLLNKVATACTVTSTIAAVVADETAGIFAAPEVPASITNTNEIKIITVYSDKLLETSQKNTFLTWGNSLFTNQNLRLIQELTQADGHLTPTGRLTASGEGFIQKQLHSKIKILVFQILTMLSDGAYKVIKHQSDDYM